MKNHQSLIFDLYYSPMVNMFNQVNTVYVDSLDTHVLYICSGVSLICTTWIQNTHSIDQPFCKLTSLLLMFFLPKNYTGYIVTKLI